MARYLVGIDLGTTNSALAYVGHGVARPRGGPKLHTFDVPQVVAAGQVRRAAAAAVVPVPPRPARPRRRGRSTCRGRRTRRTPSACSPATTGRRCPAGWCRRRSRGCATPAWTAPRRCCRGPAPPDVPRLSPLEVVGEVPQAHRRGLERRPRPQARGPARRADGGGHRAGVVRRRGPQPHRRGREAGRAEARHAAGGAAGRVLRLARHALRRRKPAKLKPGMRCLVVDVGGGTSDFSLIRAGEEKGEITFVRDAVGDHLLLGGDNMDLALAKAVEAKLPGGRLDAAQFGALVQACRAGEGGAARRARRRRAYPVTVDGQGAVGGRRHGVGEHHAGGRDGGALRRVLPARPVRRRAGRGARAGLAGDGPAVRLRPGGDASTSRRSFASTCTTSRESPTARRPSMRSSSTAACSSPRCCASGSSR